MYLHSSRRCMKKMKTCESYLVKLVQLAQCFPVAPALDSCSQYRQDFGLVVRQVLQETRMFSCTEQKVVLGIVVSGRFTRGRFCVALRVAGVRELVNLMPFLFSAENNVSFPERVHCAFVHSAHANSSLHSATRRLRQFTLLWTDMLV